MFVILKKVNVKGSQSSQRKSKPKSKVNVQEKVNTEYFHEGGYFETF